MKKSILAVALCVILISAVLLGGCKRVEIGSESGPTTTRSYDFTDFTSIEIGHAFKLEVTPADTYSITISAGESLFDNIEVTQKGSRLEIGMDRLLFHFNRSPSVKITMPELRGLYMAGASEGNVTGFKSSQDFDLSLSGASELYMDMETGDFESELSGASEVSGHLTATSCDITLSGASEIDLAGSGGNVKINASGASWADLENLDVNNAAIDFSGASEGSLNIDGRLDVSLSGASFLEYAGNPTLGDLNLSGGSEIKNRNR